MIFERCLEDNLFDTHEALANGGYRHGHYEPFTIHDPKQRTIHKATVQDRLVHQAVVNVVEPLFEKRFIHDSYSCRVGKGTHAAIARLRCFLQEASRNGTRTIYALKCDIRKFFASVHHSVLSGLLERCVRDPQALGLLRHILESFSTAPGKGIPLGNLTSQLFANVYLHELDRHIKHDLRIRHYVRYCDDFVILVGSRTEAKPLAERIDAFLRDRLKVELHPDKIHMRTWTQGVDFLGYVLMPQVTVLRTQTARRMVGRISPGNQTSYFGLCSHASTHRLQQSMCIKLWGETPEKF